MNKPREYFYSLWFRIKGQENARLLDDEPTFLSKTKAFKRAHELAKDNYFVNTIILIRRITVGSRECVQWEIDCDAERRH